MSDFDRVGGEARLRELIGTFTAKVYQDAMIGFLFHGKDQERITEMEYRHAAQFLGGPVVYDGRPIGQVHRKLPIMGGHFLRRRKILENTLLAYDIPEDIRQSWLAHVDSLASAVLGKSTSPGECDHDDQLGRLPKD
jgi:truncated hemoglobin YjbI